jgi:AcrR family transcriptional regulator
MARTLNHATHAVRRDEILDVAERLIRSRGYDSMGVQDIQDELGVSRGAIYHYFNSKEAILEAVVDRITEAAMAVVTPIATDPSRSAPAKLQDVFAVGGRWKAERSDLLMAVLRSWYAPGNDLVRARTEAAALREFVPLLDGIVRQGAEEGVMDPTSPRHAAQILASLFYGSGDALFHLVVDRMEGRIAFEEVELHVRAYAEAIERILGLPPGSFTLIDDESLRVWFA